MSGFKMDGFITRSQLEARARRHKIISYWKSAIRLAGYALLPVSLGFAAGVLFTSELLGIAEEVWGS